jgi:hypothetical protein
MKRKALRTEGRFARRGELMPNSRRLPKPRSWYRTFLEDPRGIMTVGETEIPIKASHPRSERLLKAIDKAYLEKYKTPGSIQYAKDLGKAKSRRTTTELLPRA